MQGGPVAPAANVRTRWTISSVSTAPIGCGTPIGGRGVGSVASIAVTFDSTLLAVGEQTQAAATFLDVNGNVLNGPLVGRFPVWTSSNSAIATVTQKGVVKAISAGTASITAAGSGTSGQAMITVTATTISGTVATAQGLPVGGGVVEILSGATIVQAITVTADGKYRSGGLAAGTYGVRLQPPLTHSMGPSEPAQHTVTIGSGSAGIQAFVVQPAVWSDDMQSYTTTAQIVGGCTGGVAGSFFTRSGLGDVACSTPAMVSLDLTGGNSTGEKAIRYDWAPRPAPNPIAGYCGAEETIAVQPRLNPAPLFPDTIWVRFTSKESAGFVPGSASCNPAYKFFLLNVGPGDPNGRFDMIMAKNFASQLSPPAMAMSIDGSTGATQGPTVELGAAYLGKYHTWAIQIFNMTAPMATFRIYYDGNVIQQVNGPFYPAGTIIGGRGQTVTLQMGANINNGPDGAMTRWFREIGIYFTRPSLRPLPQ